MGETTVRLWSRDGVTFRTQPPPSSRKRRHEQPVETVPAEDTSHFDAAQSQLLAEMVAAGLAGALPMSFGGRAAPATSRKRRRASAKEANVQVAKPVETQKNEQLEPLEKVHVTFDSDGEVAERRVEVVAAPLEPPSDNTATSEGEVLSERVNDGDDSSGCVQHSAPVPKAIRKYWLQRYHLFYKYDDGIQLDHESWYSVTPQAIAEHIAARLACDVIVDPFAGCGGNVIQLARTCKHVIAIDIDPAKIRMAQHNARVYGVAHKVEWIIGDALALLPTLKADAVFLSPPWGGLGYSRQHFRLDEMLVQRVSGVELFALARQVAANVAYYLPKATPDAALEALAGPGELVECEKIFLNNQLKVVTAYYGGLARRPRSVNDGGAEQ